MFDANWELIHSKRQWGKYPKEELIRWALGGRFKRGARILDLGSGQAGSTWFLAREGFCPIALDGSYSALLKGRSTLDAEKLPYLAVQSDLIRLPFVAQCFDGVVDVVSSAHNTYGGMSVILGEVLRVLKPGGHFFSVIPTNKCSRRTFMGLITSFFEEFDLEHMLRCYFTKIEILRSSYQLDKNTTIDTWIVSCVSKPSLPELKTGTFN